MQKVSSYAMSKLLSGRNNSRRFHIYFYDPLWFLIMIWFLISIPLSQLRSICSDNSCYSNNMTLWKYEKSDFRLLQIKVTENPINKGRKDASILQVGLPDSAKRWTRCPRGRAWEGSSSPGPEIFLLCRTNLDGSARNPETLGFPGRRRRRRKRSPRTGERCSCSDRCQSKLISMSIKRNRGTTDQLIKKDQIVNCSDWKWNKIKWL